MNLIPPKILTSLVVNGTEHACAVQMHQKLCKAEASRISMMARLRSGVVLLLWRAAAVQKSPSQWTSRLESRSFPGGIERDGRVYQLGF